jgi:hypothetical protein
MNVFQLLSLGISLVALALSVLSVYRSFSTRRADHFAKLWDEYNTAEFGTRMECVGEWLSAVAATAGMQRQGLTEELVRENYRNYLDQLRQKGVNTKSDPVEDGRRSIKAFYVKLLVYYEGGDISLDHYRVFATPDRVHLMKCIFNMTREQTDWWKFAGEPRKPLSRNSSDEPFFNRIERMAESGRFNQRAT